LHAGAGLCHPAIQERSSKPLRSCCMPHHPAANSLEWLSVSPSGRMVSILYSRPQNTLFYSRV
jgi:hypothetical protein